MATIGAAQAPATMSMTDLYPFATFAKGASAPSEQIASGKQGGNNANPTVPWLGMAAALILVRILIKDA